MTKLEKQFHLETSNNENTDNNSSAHDTTSSTDEDNEPTPESWSFVAHNLCITKEIVFERFAIVLSF